MDILLRRVTFIRVDWLLGSREEKYVTLEKEIAEMKRHKCDIIEGGEIIRTEENGGGCHLKEKVPDGEAGRLCDQEYSQEK